MTDPLPEKEFFDLLSTFDGKVFSTLEFRNELKSRFPDKWNALVQQYGAGGRGGGTFFSANTRIGQILQRYAKQKFIDKLDYEEASEGWGSPIIRYWVEVKENRVASNRGRDTSDGGYVFISYSKKWRETAIEITNIVEKENYKVWFDADLQAGSHWRDAVIKQLDGAAAVIVIWTPDSVKSDWVRSEAQRALRQKKLIPVYVPELDPEEDIPLPFGEIHTLAVSDQSGLLRSLRSLLDH